MKKALATWLPNADCCNTDNPNHLCPTCQAEYDREQPRPANYFGAANQQPTGNFDPDDILPLPPPTVPNAGSDIVHNVPDDEGLPLPRTVETIVNERRKATRQTASQDADYLPLPTMKF